MTDSQDSVLSIKAVHKAVSTGADLSCIIYLFKLISKLLYFEAPGTRGPGT